MSETTENNNNGETNTPSVNLPSPKQMLFEAIAALNEQGDFSRNTIRLCLKEKYGITWDYFMARINVRIMYALRKGYLVKSNATVSPVTFKATDKMMKNFEQNELVAVTLTEKHQPKETVENTVEESRTNAVEKTTMEAATSELQRLKLESAEEEKTNNNDKSMCKGAITETIN